MSIANGTLGRTNLRFRSLKGSNIARVILFVPYRDGIVLSVYPRVLIENSLHPRL